MNIAIYVRDSGGPNQDVSMQLNDLRRYAKARNLTIKRIYRDDHVSSGKKIRPQLNELMSDVRKCKFDGVLIWRFDRFARNTVELLSALEEFNALKVDFISYKENIDTSTPMGKVLFTVIAAIGEFNRHIIRENIAAGVQNFINEKGYWGPQKAKFDHDEIKRLRKSGLSLSQVAKIGCSRSLVQAVTKAG